MYSVLAFALFARLGAALVKAGVVWPTCAQPQTTLLGTQNLAMLTAFNVINDTLFQPTDAQPPFTAVMCNTTDYHSGKQTSALCVTPSSNPNANTYAVVGVELAGSNAPSDGTLVEVSFRVEFVEGIDTFNLFGYGFQVSTLLGYVTDEGLPVGPAFGLSTGSLPAYLAYPDWDTVVPLASVWPLQPGFFCDSLILFNENSSTPCKFYQLTDMSGPMRAAWFDVSVTFNMTAADTYVTRASVMYNGTNMLFSLADLTPRWSTVSHVPLSSQKYNPLLGIMSTRSPFRMWNLYANAVLPGCPTLSAVPVSSETTTATTIAASPATTETQASTPQTVATGETLPQSIGAPTTAATATSTTANANVSTNSMPVLMPADALHTSPRSITVVDDTPLFVALLVAFTCICCLVLSCTVFRKRIRRSAPVRAMYSAVPAPARRALCYPCHKLDYELGSNYEEGEQRPVDQQPYSHHLARPQLPPPIHNSLPRANAAVAVGDVPFDAVDAGDADVVDTDSPRTIVSGHGVGGGGGGGVANPPAPLHPSSDYALVGFASNRGDAGAGAHQSADEYSALPAGVGVPAVANGNAHDRTEYHLPPPPPPSSTGDVTLARSIAGVARPRSPTARRTAAGAHVEYDRVMLPPRYDRPGDKFE